MKKRIIASILILILPALFLMCSCSKKITFSMEDFENQGETNESVYKFDSQQKSERAKFNKQRLSEFKEDISNETVKYEYPKLFNYAKAMKGVSADHSVKKHKFSALDANGKLTKENLIQLVRKNNVEYLTPLKTELLKDVEDDLLDRICEIIVDTTNDILEEFPDIDRDRVYCNLGNLKVIEKSAAVDFAAVEAGMVLHVNRTTAQMADLFTEHNMYNVLVHETMHIIQFGCTCEDIKGCTRRCGLAHAYEDWEQSYADWIWMAEGSAERMTALYTNTEPMTYKTMVNYLVTIDLSTMLQSNISANYVETLCFYGDVDKLFKLFGANTEKEKQEIYNMIYSLEIMQNDPNDVKRKYKKVYGQEWTDDVRDEVSRKIKRPIVKTLAKAFFTNLAESVERSNVTKNDVFFLINLYERTINYHLDLDVKKYDSYNAEFVKWYKGARSEFFDAFENLTEKEYEEYKINKPEKNMINAGMKWVDADKQQFLIEKFEAVIF